MVIKMQKNTFGSSITLLLVLLVAFVGINKSYAQISVSLPTVTGGLNNVDSIPVEVSDLTGQNAFAYDITITFDATILEVASVEIAGTISAGVAYVENITPGEVTVSAASGGSPLTGSGTLFLLEVMYVGEGSTDLTITFFRFNEGVPASTTTNGSVSVYDNQPPTAEDVSVGTNEDTPVSIQLEGSDPEGLDLQFAIASHPANGSLGILNVTSGTTATVIYTPDTDFSGTDTFEYSVSDEENTTTATVTVTVAGSNDTPDAMDDSYDVEEDQTLTVTEADGVLSNDTDAEGDPLTASLLSDVSNGTLDLDSDGSFSYEPDPDFSGTDTFTYEASDGVTEDAATVTIIVANVNDAPSESTITSPADGTSLTIGGPAGGTPVDGSETLLTVTWSGSVDPDGDPVSYLYELAKDLAFSNILFSQTYLSTAGLSLTVAEMADLYDQAVSKNASTAVFHRITTSDGTLTTVGFPASLNLTRGLVTGNESTSELPEVFSLHGNYPNPFNPSTNIVFDLPEAAEVSIHIIDLLGRDVLEVPAKPMEAGSRHSVLVDASSLVSGTYVYRVTARMVQSVEVSEGTMTLVK